MSSTFGLFVPSEHSTHKLSHTSIDSNTHISSPTPNHTSTDTHTTTQDTQTATEIQTHMYKYTSTDTAKNLITPTDTQKSLNTHRSLDSQTSTVTHTHTFRSIDHSTTITTSSDKHGSIYTSSDTLPSTDTYTSTCSYTSTDTYTPNLFHKSTPLNTSTSPHISTYTTPHISTHRPISIDTPISEYTASSTAKHTHTQFHSHSDIHTPSNLNLDQIDIESKNFTFISENATQLELTNILSDYPSKSPPLSHTSPLSARNTQSHLSPPYLLRGLILSFKWNIWLLGATLIFILRAGMGAYHFFRIFIDLWLFVALHFVTRALRWFQCAANLYNQDPTENLLQQLDEAQTFKEWHELCYRLDEINGGLKWRETAQSDIYDWEALSSHLKSLKMAREKNDSLSIIFLLRRCCNRHFCNLSNPELFVKASSGTKYLISDYQNEVCEAMKYLYAYMEEKIENLGGALSDYSKLSFNVSNTQDFLNDLHCTRKGDTEGDIQPPSENNFTNFMASNAPQFLHPSLNTQSNSTGDHSKYSSTMDTPKSTHSTYSDNNTHTSDSTEFSNAKLNQQAREIQELRHFFADLRLSMGRTALCLSGGGSLAMYHVGVVREMIEQNILPRVISGASGGAIVAAMLAIHDDETLLEDIFVPNICDRYGRRWFPPLAKQIRNLIETGFTTRPDEFAKTCQAYFGTWTFGQAYKKTGRLVSIVCSPHNKFNSEALVLNCVNTPDVMLWSAVAASCALPGLVAPSELYSKNSNGEVIPAFPCGFKWMDGSIKLDIPQKELAAYFNVKQFVVSQVNPHAAPFVMTYSSDGRFARSIENWLTLDIKTRYSIMAQFNMIPKIFGQNISTIWMVQEFEGHVTITPRASLLDWYRLINQPSQEDMKYFLISGRSRIWPHIERIKHLVAIEKSLQDYWTKIEKKLNSLKHTNYQPLTRTHTPSNMVECVKNDDQTTKKKKMNKVTFKLDLLDNTHTPSTPQNDEIFKANKTIFTHTKDPQNIDTFDSDSSLNSSNDSPTAVCKSCLMQIPTHSLIPHNSFTKYTHTHTHTLPIRSLRRRSNTENLACMRRSAEIALATLDRACLDDDVSTHQQII